MALSTRYTLCSDRLDVLPTQEHPAIDWGRVNANQASPFSAQFCGTSIGLTTTTERVDTGNCLTQRLGCRDFTAELSGSFTNTPWGFQPSNQKLKRLTSVTWCRRAQFRPSRTRSATLAPQLTRQLPRAIAPHDADEIEVGPHQFQPLLPGTGRVVRMLSPSCAGGAASQATGWRPATRNTLDYHHGHPRNTSI
jgi:hypothetical protein